MLRYTLPARQMVLYGKVAKMPGSTLQRQAALAEGGVHPAKWQGGRGRGRPRQQWATSVYQHVHAAVGAASDVEQALRGPKTEWNNTVRSYVQKLATSECQSDAG